MGNDKTQRPRRSETARQAAWQRQEAARRDAARIGIGPQAAHPAHPGNARSGRPADPKGIRGMESRTATVHAHAADPDAAPHDAQAPRGSGAGRAGNGGNPTAAAEAAAAEERQRAEAAAREQFLYAQNRARDESAESVDAPAEPVVSTPEQTEVLAKLLGSMFVTASALPARARSAQWPPGPTGEPAGDFWRIGPDEAMELGRCWAAVIAIYAPVEMIGGASVLVVAIASTSISLGSRAIQDAERAREFRALLAAAEQRAAATAARAAA